MQKSQVPQICSTHSLRLILANSRENVTLFFNCPTILLFLIATLLSDSNKDMKSPIVQNSLTICQIFYYFVSYTREFLCFGISNYLARFFAIFGFLLTSTTHSRKFRISVVSLGILSMTLPFLPISPATTFSLKQFSLIMSRKLFVTSLKTSTLGRTFLASTLVHRSAMASSMLSPRRPLLLILLLYSPVDSVSFLSFSALTSSLLSSLSLISVCYLFFPDAAGTPVMLFLLDEQTFVKQSNCFFRNQFSLSSDSFMRFSIFIVYCWFCRVPAYRACDTCDTCVMDFWEWARRMGSRSMLECPTLAS